jgi:hypothetical protein
MMGDALPEHETATFHAEVIGGVTTAFPRTLVVYRDGSPFLTTPVVPGGAFSYSFAAPGPGDYRIQVMRGSAIDALSNPITLGPRPVPGGPAPGPPSDPDAGPRRPAGPTSIKLSASPRRVRAGRKVRFRFKVLSRGGGPAARVAGATVRFGGRKARTGIDGLARITVRHTTTGRKRASASKPGLGKAVAKLRVLPAKPRR